MAKQQIGLLFGVKGNGSISGESGQLILQQLNKIARSIDNTNNRIKVTIGVNENQTRQLIQRQLNNISKGLKVTIGGNPINNQNSQRQVRDLTRQIENAKNRLAAMGGDYDVRKYNNGNVFDTNGRQIIAVSQAYQAYTQAVEDALNAERAMIANRNPQTQQAFIDAVNEAKTAQQQLNATFNNSTAFNKQELIYNKVIARITEYQAKNKETLKNTPELAAKLEELNQQLAGGTFAGTETDANNRFVKLTNDIRAAGGEAETLGQKIKRVFGEKLGYGIMATAAMMARRVFREMYNNVVQIDTAMTELKKVTNETDVTYRKFLEGSADRAQKLGATISDVVTATADFARLGYNLEDASTLSDVATVYKNVGDGINDINTASESIISTMKAFKYEASNAMSIVDKFNEVGNNYAISSKGVGDVLLRSASAMATANNTLDETIALATAANTIVQDPEKVGTAIKTVSMYLRAAKTEAEDAGEATDGMAESVSELQKELLALTGGKVNILQADGKTYKSTYQQLKELSQVYNQLSDVSRANILELIGGKRNSNVTSAILQNFDVAERVLATSMNSAGSALEENEKYLNSINGKVAQLKATFQDVSQNVIDSDAVKGVIDFGNGLLKVVDFLAEIKALLPAIIAGFMSWKNVGKLNSSNMPAYAQLQLVA